MNKTKFKLLPMFLVIAMAVMTMSMSVFAEDATSLSGNCGAEGEGSNVTWSLTENNDNLEGGTQAYTLTISGSGAMADYNRSTSGGTDCFDLYAVTDSPWMDYLNQITSVDLDENITHIGDSAFNGLSNLKMLPWEETTYDVTSSKLTSIGEFAFAGTGIDKVTFLGDVTEYGMFVFQASQVSTIDWTGYNCSDKTVEKLTGYTVNNDQYIVQYGMFAECGNITYINLPESFVAIDQFGFRNTGITALNFPTDAPGVYIIEEAAFRSIGTLESLVLPNQDSTIYGSMAFMDNNNANFTTITVPGYDEENSNNDQMFRNCTYLETVVLEEEITTVTQNMFRDCSSIVSLSLPTTLTTIESYSFNGAFNGADVTINDDVTVGQYAFNSINAGNFVVGDDVTLYDQNTFNSATMYAFYVGSGLTFETTSSNRLLPTSATITSGYVYINTDDLYFSASASTSYAVVVGTLASGITHLELGPDVQTIRINHSSALINLDTLICAKEVTITDQNSSNKTSDYITYIIGEDSTWNIETATPMQDGYIFEGWYTDSTLATKVESVEANGTYYANYTLNATGGIDHDILVTYDQDLEDTYKVDITWGAMTFEYTDVAQVWNTETMTWDNVEGSVASWATTGNEIYIENHSSLPVQVDLSYQNEADQTMSVSFDSTSFEMPAPTESVDSTKTVTVTPAGFDSELSEALTQIGTITIKITEVTD